MTAMLNEIRILDARRARGDISPEEYTRARNALLQNVEEANTHFIDITPKPAPPPPPQPARNLSSALGFSVVVCLAVMGLCISLTLLFLPDLNLALTLGVTILAALSVGLLREKGE